MTMHDEHEDPIHLALEERLGELQPPADLADRVLSQGDAERADALRRVALAESSRSWARSRLASLPWLAAGLLLLGVGVSFAAGWIANETPTPEDAPSPATQDPQIVRPKNRAQFLELVAKVRSISVQAAHSPADPTETRGLPAVVVDAKDEVAAIVAGFAKEFRELDPAGWKWSNRIELRLADGRRMEIALNLFEDRRIGVRGLGDFAIPKTTALGLRRHVVRADWLARKALGIVQTSAEFEKLAKDELSTELERLTLRGLVDSDLERLEDFPKLRELDLTRTRAITDAGMVHVAECLRLEKLTFRYALFGDDGLRKLAALPHLRELNFEYTAAKQVPLLADIPTIGQLFKQSGRMSGAGFDAFDEHDALRVVDVSNSASLTDEGLGALVTIPNLESLDLSGRRLGKVTDIGLRQLTLAKNLRTLSLEDLPLDVNGAIPFFAENRMLRSLDVSGTNVGSRLEALARSELEELDVGHCKSLDDDAFRQIARMRKLRVLRMRMCRSLTGDSMTALQTLRNLEVLDLSNHSYGVQDGIELPTLPALRELDLSFTGADDDTIMSLTRMESLRKLNLAGNHGITDDGLRQLAKMPWLEELSLNVCRGFGTDGVEAVREALTQTRVTWPDEFRRR